MANLTKNLKVTYKNANPRGSGDNRLASIPAKARHLNDVIDSMNQSMVNTGNVAVLGTTGAVTLTTAANVGVQNLIVATTGAVTYTLPTPRVGDVMKFNSVSAAIMGHNVIFKASADDSIFFVGGLKHSDINADTAGAFSNGSSNAVLTCTVPTTLDITMIGKSSTEWYVFGSVTQTAAITFADN